MSATSRTDDAWMLAARRATPSALGTVIGIGVDAVDVARNLEAPVAEMGLGYGSECHLLRYLGRHRRRLDQIVKTSVGAEASSEPTCRKGQVSVMQPPRI